MYRKLLLPHKSIGPVRCNVAYVVEWLVTLLIFFDTTYKATSWCCFAAKKRCHLLNQCAIYGIYKMLKCLLEYYIIDKRNAFCQKFYYNETPFKMIQWMSGHNYMQDSQSVSHLMYYIPREWVYFLSIFCDFHFPCFALWSEYTAD